MTSKRTADKPPPLAGICTFDEAQRPGLSVDECVCRLKRYHYSLKRLHQVFNDRIPSEPVYELKMAFSLHSHYCAEHVAALRQRIGEMREPPLGLEAVPDEHLEILFDEILAAGQGLTGERPGVTGRLVVRYRRITPIDTDLVFRSWVERDRGLRLDMRAECVVAATLDDDQPTRTADAEAFFVRRR